MSNMHTLGAKLPGQRLRDGPNRKLAGRKVGKLDSAAQRGGGARDNQCRWVRRRSVYRLEEEGQGCLGEVEEAVACQVSS